MHGMIPSFVEVGRNIGGWYPSTYAILCDKFLIGKNGLKLPEIKSSF